MSKEINKGVWLDIRKAYIIDPTNEDKFFELNSEIEEGNPKGGARSKTAFGPQDVISEKQLLERRKNQTKEYMQRVMGALKGATHIVIFGPAEMKNELHKTLSNSPEFKTVKLATKPLDSLTIPQIKAEVRAYFG